MREKLISVLVSLIFIPVAVLAQYFGMLIGELWWYLVKNLPFVYIGEFIGALLVGLISGAMAGYVSSFCIQKAYNKFITSFVMIIPSVLIIMATIGNILVYVQDNESFGDLLQQLIREASTIYIFYYCLKNRILKIN